MTLPLNPEDLYHTGIVVSDLEAATRRLSTSAGYTWTKPLEGPVSILTQPGAQDVASLRFCYSLQAPHLELIEEVPGTPWTAAAGNAIHHLGYFTDDYGATAAGLEAQGFAREMCMTTDGSTPSTFAYYTSPEGIRIEIVDRTVFGSLDTFLEAFG